MSYLPWTEVLWEGLRSLTQKFIDYLPAALGALALVVAGWILARTLRGLTRRLGKRLGWLLQSRLVERPLKQLGVERPASEVVGSVVFWTVLLFFITAATETLGLPVIASWLASLSYYLPRVLVGLLIVFVGLLTASIAGDAIQKAATAAGLTQAAILGQAARLGILLIAVVTAVEQLGVDTKFLTATITIVVGAVIGGAALAFALGARTHVGNLIAAHYLRQVYREGQTIKVAGVQGRIVEILPAAAILETTDGRVLIPAAEFSQELSVQVASET